jgi:transglutaminase-like putative cysteine protease
MPTFRIQHITKYTYDRPVKENISQIRIFPIEDQRQQLISNQLQISFNPEMEFYFDYYGNMVGEFSWLLPHHELTVDSRVVVQTPDNLHEPKGSEVYIKDVLPHVERDVKLIWLSEPERIERQQTIIDLLFETDISAKPIEEIAKACNSYVFNQFQYQKGITTVETTIDEILEHKSGVCQDFAHVLLQMLRTLGIPARYVSGYICPNKSGMRGEGATHAWVEYFHPEAGWVGLDPTNNVFAGAYHVRLATGRHFTDCSPVKGAFKGLAHQQLSVFVSVGYEDGHVFENLNDVELGINESEGTEPWQDELMAKQQQQQQQQQQQ